MRGRTVVTSVIALGISLSSQAGAQGAPPPAPAPANPAPVAPPAENPAPAPLPGPRAPGEPVAPPPAPVAPSAPADAPPPPPAPTPAPAPAPPAPLSPSVAAPVEPPLADPEPDLPPPEDYGMSSDAWYDTIEFSAFVDGYLGFNYNFPKPQSGKNRLRAHDYANGFALSWVGVNASYPADPVGATISLRFGPTARQIGNSCVSADKSRCDSAEGLENVKQGFVSWKPGGPDSAITLDLGKFDTPFGAEVADSHLNMNYTRSMLYASQPVFHTGLRASFAFTDVFDFRVLAVNGWNNSIDNNVGKSFGAQGTLHLPNADGDELLTASLGYLGGPEQDDNFLLNCPDGTVFSASGCVATTRSAADVIAAGDQQGLVDRDKANSAGWRHLIDLAVAIKPIERLQIIVNADLGIENQRTAQDPNQFEAEVYYGALLGARVAVIEEFGIAARAEFFHDPKGFISGYAIPMNLVGGTLTLDFLPADYLTLRLDGRLDWAERQIFDKSIRDKTGTQFTTTLGVVAHTN